MSMSRQQREKCIGGRDCIDCHRRSNEGFKANSLTSTEAKVRDRIATEKVQH
jgi:hypothetical protein